LFVTDKTPVSIRIEGCICVSRVSAARSVHLVPLIPLARGVEHGIIKEAGLGDLRRFDSRLIGG
jgi:hypothetical protein